MKKSTVNEEYVSQLFHYRTVTIVSETVAENDSMIFDPLYLFTGWSHGIDIMYCFAGGDSRIIIIHYVDAVGPRSKKIQTHVFLYGKLGRHKSMRHPVPG